MTINLPADQEAFIGHLVALGQFGSADEAISESVRLLASREHLKEQVRIGIEQANGGEVIDHDSLFAQLRTMVTAQHAQSGQ